MIGNVNNTFVISGQGDCKQFFLFHYLYAIFPFLYKNIYS